MYGSPHKRGELSSPLNRSKAVPLKGLYKDGIWHCNCNPRLPAVHFIVKKDGPNKGRWFYTCQEPKEDSCDFFLWDGHAAAREIRAVVNNTRSEVEQQETSSDALRDKRTIEGHNAASNKRINGLGESKGLKESKGSKDGENFGEGPLPGTEDMPFQIAEHSVPGAYPETPRKSVKTDRFQTPSTKRKRDDYLPTPATNTKREDMFYTPSNNRPTGGMWEGNETRVGSASITPTPGRFRDASVSGDSQGSGINEYDITEEVMDLLKDQHLDQKTSSGLQSLLNKHALKISGIAKGRDITRIALKSKDARIVELQQKINALETEREMDKTLIKQYIHRQSTARDVP